MRYQITKKIAVIIISLFFVQAVYSVPINKPKIAKAAIELCHYAVPDLKGWSRGKLGMGLSNSLGSLKIKKKSVDAVILCVRKTVTMKQWIDGTKRNLVRQFKEYELLDEFSSRFHGKDAYWFIYKARSYGSKTFFKGKLIIVDLGNRGFIISIACPEKDFDEYSNLFDEVMTLFIPIK